MLISFEKTSLQLRFQVPRRHSTALAGAVRWLIVFNLKEIKVV